VAAVAGASPTSGLAHMRSESCTQVCSQVELM
jgi:hypothetical protein